MADAMTGDSGSIPASDAAPCKPKTGFARVLSWGLRLGGLAVLVALGIWIWQYRALFDPVADLVKAWRMGNAPWTAPQQDYTAHKVIDGENIQVRGERNRLFTIRLAGLEAPSGASYDPAVRERAEASREFLQSLVQTNAVQVEVTLTNAARVILGFVHIGKTNVNAASVAAGHATFRADYLGSASLQNRWAMLQADRRATDIANAIDNTGVQ